MAFSDTFYLLGAALLVALVATLLLRKPAHADAARRRPLTRSRAQGSRSCTTPLPCRTRPGNPRAAGQQGLPGASLRRPRGHQLRVRSSRPEPGAGEVLVRVKAAGVGPWDGWIRAGKSVLPQPLPLTLGSDLSGVVVSGRAGRHRLRARRRGLRGDQPPLHRRLCRLRDRLGRHDRAQAQRAGPTSTPPPSRSSRSRRGRRCSSRPAWSGVRRVLIHGAAGSVGAYAVQFAHQAGARVIATCGRRRSAYVRGLGADVVVDYRDGPASRTSCTTSTP